MKKRATTIGTLLLLASGAASAETIRLVKEDGTFLVPVLINEKITLDFTLDSGAADVSIPADVFSTLRRAGTIDTTDLLGSGIYVLADGAEQRQQRFRIRTLRVGGLELHDVAASVAPASGPLLLGQSFLGRLSSWTIDNQRHVLLINESPRTDSGPLETTMSAGGEGAGTKVTMKERSERVPLEAAFVSGEVGHPGRIEYVRHSRGRANSADIPNSLLMSFSLVPSGCRVDITRSESIDGSEAVYVDAFARLNRTTTIEVSPESAAANARDKDRIVTRVDPSLTTITFHTTGSNGLPTGQFPYLLFYDADIASQVAQSIRRWIELCGP